MAKKPCPSCGNEMTEKAHGVFKCTSCGGVFLPASLIGIHSGSPT